MKKNKKVTKIAELLPEGLTPATVTEIAKLFEQRLVEEIEAERNKITSKVEALFRARIDSLKEQAIKELENENEDFRKLQVFNQVRSLMAVELTESDTQNAITTIANESKQLEEGVQALTEELTKVIAENSKYEKVIEVLNDKVEELEEKVKSTLTENTQLKEHSKKPFKSSEKAVMVSRKENVDAEERTSVPNEFLTEEVLKHMPTRQVKLGETNER